MLIVTFSWPSQAHASPWLYLQHVLRCFLPCSAGQYAADFPADPELASLSCSTLSDPERLLPQSGSSSTMPRASMPGTSCQMPFQGHSASSAGSRASLRHTAAEGHAPAARCNCMRASATSVRHAPLRPLPVMEHGSDPVNKVRPWGLPLAPEEPSEQRLYQTQSAWA